MAYCAHRDWLWMVDARRSRSHSRHCSGLHTCVSLRHFILHTFTHHTGDFRIPVVDGSALTPAELGSLTVVEQSVGSPPKLETYTLSGMTQGEMWIYRPICMREYVGFEFEVAPSPGVPVIAV